jgi:hypothetical protein
MINPLPQSYSLAELQAHPDLLFAMLPDPETRVIIERDTKGNGFVFIPSAKPSKEAHSLVEQAKTFADSLAATSLLPTEAQQRFLALRDELASEMSEMSKAGNTSSATEQ